MVQCEVMKSLRVPHINVEKNGLLWKRKPKELSRRGAYSREQQHRGSDVKRFLYGHCCDMLQVWEN